MRLVITLEPLRRIRGDTARFFYVARRFAKHLRSRRRALAAGMGLSILTALLRIAEPWPLKVLFDDVLGRERTRILGMNILDAAGGDRGVLITALAASIVVIAALGGIVYYVQNVLLSHIGQQVVNDMRRELFVHLERLPLAFHRRARAGDLLMRLTGDIIMLREMLVASLLTTSSQLFVTLGMAVLMFTLSPVLALVSLAVAPILFVLLTVFNARITEAASQQRKREGVIASAMHEVLSSIHLVQACTQERNEEERFRALNRRTLRAGMRTTRLEARMHRSVEIAVALGTCGVVGLGAHDVLAGKLTAGELIVFLAYLRHLYRPMRQLSKVTERSAKAAACGERVLEILDTPVTIADRPGARKVKHLQGRIAFENVEFSYEDGARALRGVTFSVESGEKAALVGPTGAGKTTILALIPRFYDASSGTVRLDGIDVRDVMLRSLRSHISLLLQDAIVLGTTVRENIAYGRPGATDAEIGAAAAAAQADGFIRRLREGYDTVVGERGATLSGGEKQRIAIARAILRDAPILLLDEPTTGLDPLSERAVLAALEALTRSKTTVTIAHRLGTIVSSDRIFFIENGTIAESGRHEELLECGGRYRKFIEAQFGPLAIRSSAWG